MDSFGVRCHFFLQNRNAQINTDTCRIVIITIIIDKNIYNIKVFPRLMDVTISNYNKIIDFFLLL